MTVTGYASGVVNDGLISYGPFTTHQIAYTFDAGNGFSVGAAVEEGSNDEQLTARSSRTTCRTSWSARPEGRHLGRVGVVGYDSVKEEFAIKGRVDITPTDMFSFFVMGAWSDVDGDDDDDFATRRAMTTATTTPSGAANGPVGWRCLALQRPFTLNGEFGYNDFGDYSLDADVNITVVPGFVVTPGVGYMNNDDDADDDEEQWGGYLRTQFTF